MRVIDYLFTCVWSLILNGVSCDYRSEADDIYGKEYRGQYDNTRPKWEREYELPHAISEERCDDVTREPEVPTNFGRVKGRTISICDWPGLKWRQRPGQSESRRDNYKTVNVFLGIPYAEPPTRRNDLQFKPPRFPQKWRTLNTVSYKPSCPQNAKYLGYDRGVNNTDEDCLYLNIFSPDMKNPIPGKKYSVMMFIHGGNFDHGSANLFPGHVLAATQDVVVVTFNYRLGHLGFLSTSDENSVGNYGILDQQLALKWVYENIAHFDGDPESINLFGFDAGAASATLLAMSSVSRDMVKRVIAHNGVPVADWAVKVDPLFMFNTSRILGEALGCTTENSYRLVECVGKRSNNEIKILELKPRIGWLPWGPVVDNFTGPNTNMFLARSPEEILDYQIPFRNGFSYMAGVSRDEGSNVILDDSMFRQNYRINEDIFKKKITDFMRMYNYTINADGIFSALTFMYLPSIDLKNETLLRQGYIDLLTDRYYKAPLYKMGKLLVNKRVPTYMYVTNYTFEGYRPYQTWQGVTLETDYLLLSGAPFLSPLYFPRTLNLKAARWTEADRDMSQFMIEAWADFAKYGNPTRTRVLNTIFWEPATKENFWFLNINTTNVSVEMIPNYRERESEFWNCYIPFLIDRERPTIAPTLAPGVEELRVVTGALWGTVAAGILFMTVAFVCCLMYCRAKSKSSAMEDLSASREVIVNASVSHQDTLV